MRFFTSVLVMFLAACSSLVWSANANNDTDSYANRETVTSFIDDMVSTHKFDKVVLEKMFADAKRKDSILKAISRPAEKRLEWAAYRKIFITNDRISRGLKFMKTYRDTLSKAEKRFGVPAEIVAAIIGVETRYGRNKGSYRVLDALSTLAFDYPPRAKFFKKELEEMLLLAREQGFDVPALKGSYAGAMGYGQFIPSSYRHYAIDFDNDDVADILDNPVDAIGSVANYFVAHKWQAGEPVAFQSKVAGEGFQTLLEKSLKPSRSLKEMREQGVEIAEGYDMSQLAKLLELNADSGKEYWVALHNFYVITRYNHSHMYAMAVFQLASALAAGN